MTHRCIFWQASYDRGTPRKGLAQTWSLHAPLLIDTDRCFMAHEGMLAELDRRRSVAGRMGGEDKLAKRRSRGQLSAEDRLKVLVDEGTFFEVGLLGASSVFEKDAPSTPRDGKLTGFARIDG